MTYRVTRRRYRTDFILLHATNTSPTKDLGAAELDRKHRQRGSLCIGCHYVIRRDGTVEPGRAVDTIGAHETLLDDRSIGICMVGSLGNFTGAQEMALLDLVAGLYISYPEAQLQDRRVEPSAT